MANTFRDDPFRSEHRADEIGVHLRRAGGHRPRWLIPVLGALLLLAIAYWAYNRRAPEPAAPAFTLRELQSNTGLADLPQPRVPEKPVLPDVPEPATLEEPSKAPHGAPPGLTESSLATATGEADDPAGCAGATFHFSADDPRPSDADRAKLEELARCLKDSPSKQVQLKGRAHPVAGRPDARTEALAMRRARTIAGELERLGVPAPQLRPISSDPLCTDDDAACSARNRTVTLTPSE